eukprot:UN01083
MSATKQPPQDNKDDKKDEYFTTPEQLSDYFDYLCGEMIQCDEAYCPNLVDAYSDAIGLALSLRYEDVLKEVEQCAEKYGQDAEECDQLNETAAGYAIPIVDDKLEQLRREKYDKPLQQYHPMMYQSPFWFEGAGNLWRRWDHKGVEKDQLQSELEELENYAATATDREYTLLYPHARMARAGLNCFELRPDLLQCLADVMNHEATKKCFDAIPNIQQCSTGFNPQSEVPDLDV